MSDEISPDTLSAAAGRLGEQVIAMERELERLKANGDEVPELALEMLARLRALAAALDGLESTFTAPGADDPGTAGDSSAPR